MPAASPQVRRHTIALSSRRRHGKGSFLTNLVGGDVWSGVAYGAAPDSGWIRSKAATPKRQQAVNYRWLKPEHVFVPGQS